MNALHIEHLKNQKFLRQFLNNFIFAFLLSEFIDLDSKLAICVNPPRVALSLIVTRYYKPIT